MSWRRRCCRGRARRMSQYPQEIHNFPALLIRQTILVAWHRTVAGRDFPENLSIRHGIHNFGVGEIGGLDEIEIHGARRTLAVAFHAMAMRAAILVNSACIRQGVSVWRNRILHFPCRLRHVPIAAARGEPHAGETEKTHEERQRADYFPSANRRRSSALILKFATINTRRAEILRNLRFNWQRAGRAERKSGQSSASRPHRCAIPKARFAC